MMKIYAIEIIFKSHEPFQSYLLTGQADSAKKAGYKLVSFWLILFQFDWRLGPLKRHHTGMFTKIRNPKNGQIQLHSGTFDLNLFQIIF
jgi:hypothetical protein